MPPFKSTIKVAVVGAGAAGLCAGRHLQSEPDQFEFDIFEQQDEVGGLWRYSEKVGCDEFGLPIHSSVYKNLKTNLPKELMAFPDFPFPYCDGQSYILHFVVLQYLKDYAIHYDLYKYIKFRTLIESVSPLKYSDDSIQWSVTYVDVVSKERETKVYDAVMVCNGHYTVPEVPEIPGMNEFKNILIHSHDYRDASIFKDLKVVVLGAGPSGIDISLEIASVAKEVILSHNSSPKQGSFPENFKQERGIAHMNAKTVTFAGGNTYECDALVLCTGYKYQYPFIDSRCNLQIGNQHVSPLYLHMFLIDFPTLAIWGIPKESLSFKIYYQQTKVFLKFLKGLISLPSPEEMRIETKKDFNRRLESGADIGIFKESHAHVLRKEWFWEYDDALCKLGKIDPMPDSVRCLFRHAIELILEDWAFYRKFNYKLIDDKSFVQFD